MIYCVICPLNFPLISRPLFYRSLFSGHREVVEVSGEEEAEELEERDFVLDLLVGEYIVYVCIVYECIICLQYSMCSMCMY